MDIRYTFANAAELAEYLRTLAERRRSDCYVRTQRAKAEAEAEARGLESAADIAEASTFTPCAS